MLKHFLVLLISPAYASYALLERFHAIQVEPMSGSSYNLVAKKLKKAKKAENQPPTITTLHAHII